MRIRIQIASCKSSYSVSYLNLWALHLQKNGKSEMAEEQKTGKTCLVLLEAIGVGGDDEKNAVKEAEMPFLNSLKSDENCLYYELEANGMKVVFFCWHDA